VRFKPFFEKFREEYPVSCCWKYGVQHDLSGSAVLPIVQRIVRLTGEGVPVDYPTLLAALDDDAQRGLLTRIAFLEEPDEGPGVDDCLCTFRREALQRRYRVESRDLNDAADVNRRLMELQELARQRDALSNQ